MSVEPQAHDGPEIENLFAETRTFPPDPAFTAQANATAALYDEAEADYEAFWAAQARERLSLVDAVLHHARVGPAVREVVRRRRAERRLQLRRPPRRGGARRQGRVPLDRRARRHPDAHLRRPHARELEGGQRAAGAGRHQGRPGRDLHADDPGAADRDARLRADRRPAHRRVRRVLGGGPVRADQRLRREGPDHRGRRLAARQEGRPQAPRRRGRGGHADDRARASSSTGSATAPTWSRAATTGGTRSSSGSRTCAPRSRSRASTCSTCSTRRARPRSPRASSTPRPGTSSARRSPTGPCSTSSPTTSTGARRTSAG